MICITLSKREPSSLPIDSLRSFFCSKVKTSSSVMFFLDLFCTLRTRTGNAGLGPGALVEMLRQVF